MRSFITTAAAVVTDNGICDDAIDCYQHCRCKHCCCPCTSRADECVDILSLSILNYSNTFVQSNNSLTYGQRSHLNSQRASREGIREQMSSSAKLIQQKTTRGMKKINKRRKLNHEKHLTHHELWLLLLSCVIIAILTILNGVIAETTPKTFSGIAEKHIDTPFFKHTRSEYDNGQKKNPSFHMKTTARENLEIINNWTTKVETIAKVETTDPYISEEKVDTTSNLKFKAKPIENVTITTFASMQTNDSKFDSEKQTAKNERDSTQSPSANLRDNLSNALSLIAQVDTTRILSSVKESTAHNNNHGKNLSHFAEFHRWIAIENSEFEHIEKGRTHEIFRFYSNRSHHIRLRCEVTLHNGYFPIASDGNTPTLASVAWIRNNDETKLIDAPCVAILEIISNTTNPLENGDYRCAATFIANVTSNKKALAGSDAEIIKNDYDDSIAPTNVTVLSRMVKLLFFNDLGVYVVPSIQMTRTGDVASFYCRSNVTGSEGTPYTWNWYIGERELHDCDDDCAIKIYSASSESLLHILRVDEDAHAGIFYCQLNIGASNESMTGKSNAELRVNNKIDDDTKTSAASVVQQSHNENKQFLIDVRVTEQTTVIHVNLRVDEQRHLECLYSGSVHVRWLKADNESQIDALLKQDRNNMLAYEAIVSEETALCVDARQIASTLGNYACVTTDSHGRPLITQKFTVIVRDDLFHEEDSFNTLTRRVGTPIKLNCATYSGERVKKVVWYREGQRFHFHPRSKLAITEKFDYRNSQLALSVVEPEDHGMYECVTIATDGGERWQSLYLRVEARTKERITRLHVDVDHVEACLHVKFRLPRTVSNLNDASQATYFLAYYPVDGSAPFNNEPFNGAQCHYDRQGGKINTNGRKKRRWPEENNGGPKIIVNGEVVHKTHTGSILINDNVIFHTFDFTNEFIMPTGTTNYAIDCVLSPCADHNNHNFEAGIAYVFHVSMVLSSEHLSITPLSPPLIAYVWDAYVHHALFFEVAYEIDHSKLILRWKTPTEDELHGQLTGYEIEIAEDRTNGHSIWKTEHLEIKAREYHINVSLTEIEMVFSYRVRLVPKTRAGTPPKSHMYTASNFAFITVDSQLLMPSRIEAALDVSAPSGLEFRQIEPGWGRIRITWNSNPIKYAASDLYAQYLVVKFAEAPRHNQRRKLEKRSKRARMLTRSVLFQQGKLDIEDWLDVGYIYQMCAAIEIRKNLTIRRGFWRCARVSLLDEYGRLARIGDRPLPRSILCNDSVSDGCKCEYFPSKNVLRIIWDSIMYKEFQSAFNESALLTWEESDLYDFDTTANDAYYVIHYTYDEHNFNTPNFSIRFNAIENAEFLVQVRHDNSKLTCQSMNAAYGFADLPLITENQNKCNSSPEFNLKFFPDVKYRIMIEAQNVEYNGIPGTYFTCHIPPTAAFPPPDKFHATYNSAQKQIVFEWQPLQMSPLLKDGSNIDGYIIFLRNASKENDTFSTLHENALHYFVNGANVSKFILEDVIMNGLRFDTWITTHTSNEGDVIPSAPIHIDVTELWIPELVPPPSSKMLHTSTRTLFWQRILLPTTIALLAIFLLICGASLCLLAQIRKMQQLEKRRFSEGNKELKRKVFKSYDVEIHNARGSSSGIFTRLLSRIFKFHVNIKTEKKTKNKILDKTSLSLSPLLTRRSRDLAETPVINVEMMPITSYNGVNGSDLLFSNTYAIKNELDEGEHQDQVVGSVYYDKELPLEKDTKGGIDGCHPAGSRIFRQRMDQDSVFRHICLQAVRRLASQIPSLPLASNVFSDSLNSNIDEILLPSSSRAFTHPNLLARITSAWQRWGIPRADPIRINVPNANAQELLLGKSTSSKSEMIPPAVVPLIVDVDKRKRQTSLNTTWRNMPTSQMIVIEMVELRENHKTLLDKNDESAASIKVAVNDDKFPTKRTGMCAIKEYGEQLSQKILDDATKVAAEKLSDENQINFIVKKLVEDALHLVCNKINAVQKQIAISRVDHSNPNEPCKSQNFSSTKTYAFLIRRTRSLDNITTQTSKFNLVAYVGSAEAKRWTASHSNNNTFDNIILPLRSVRSNDILVKNHPSALLATAPNWNCIMNVNILSVEKEHIAYPAKLFTPSISIPGAYSSAPSMMLNSEHDLPNKASTIKQTNSCFHHQLSAQRSCKWNVALVDFNKSPEQQHVDHANLLLTNGEKLPSKQRNNFCHSKDVENANCISNIYNRQICNDHSNYANVVNAHNHVIRNSDCDRMTLSPNLSDSGIVYDLSHTCSLQQAASNNDEQNIDMNTHELQYNNVNTHLLLNFAYITSNNNGNALKFVESSIIKPNNSKYNEENVNGNMNNRDTRNKQFILAKNGINKRNTNRTIEFRMATTNSTTVSQQKQRAL